MKIFVIGAGGAGGYFAARWAEAGREVTVLARGSQLDAIRAGGITIRTADADTVIPLRATDNPALAATADIVFFATKTWHLADAATSIAPHIAAGAVVLGVQNGVDAAHELAAAFGAERALAGTCRIISYVEAPGVIRHVGIPPVITMGERAGGRSQRAESVRVALDVGPVLRVEASGNIELDIWRKFLFFAPVSGVGTVTRSPIGAFRAMVETRAMLRAAIGEVYEVGRARGITFAPDAPAQALTFIDGSPPDGTTSLYRDVEAGRPSEIAALSGAVSRMGRETGVATPVHDFIAAAVAPREASARARMDVPSR